MSFVHGTRKSQHAHMHACGAERNLNSWQQRPPSTRIRIHKQMMKPLRLSIPKRHSGYKLLEQHCEIVKKRAFGSLTCVMSTEKKPRRRGSQPSVVLETTKLSTVRRPLYTVYVYRDDGGSISRQSCKIRFAIKTHHNSTNSNSNSLS